MSPLIYNPLSYTLDPPQSISFEQRQGFRNNPYCLACPVEANPPPNCTWTIHSIACNNNPQDCPTVEDPGVTFRDSPCSGAEIGSYPTPPPEQYGSGCILRIDALTLDYSNYGIKCEANNSLGTFETARPIIIIFPSKLSIVQNRV